MIKLEDLSQEDQEKLLEQARLMIDEENIRKNAVAMYGIKKKDLTEKNVEEISNVFKFNHENETLTMKRNYTSMVNYLYKIAINKKYHSNPIQPITTEKEWDTYQDVSNKVKDMMISCKKGK